MIDLRGDIRHAFRGLQRSRGFAALAVVTLGIGIGGTTALFSMVDAVLLRALPYHESDRLVEIWGRQGERTGMRVPGLILETLRDPRARSTKLSVSSPMHARPARASRC